MISTLQKRFIPYEEGCSEAHRSALSQKHALSVRTFVSEMIDAIRSLSGDLALLLQLQPKALDPFLHISDDRTGVESTQLIHRTILRAPSGTLAASGQAHRKVVEKIRRKCASRGQAKRKSLLRLQ